MMIKKLSLFIASLAFGVVLISSVTRVWAWPPDHKVQTIQEKFDDFIEAACAKADCTGNYPEAACNQFFQDNWDNPSATAFFIDEVSFFPEDFGLGVSMSDLIYLIYEGPGDTDGFLTWHEDAYQECMSALDNPFQLCSSDGPFGLALPTNIQNPFNNIPALEVCADMIQNGPV